MQNWSLRRRGTIQKPDEAAAEWLIVEGQLVRLDYSGKAVGFSATDLVVELESFARPMRVSNSFEF